MKLRCVKFEFSAQRKEAYEYAGANVVASLRTTLSKVLNLWRPLALKDAVLKTLQPEKKNDH